MQKNREGRDEARVYFALWPSKKVRQLLHVQALHYQQRYGGRCMRADTLHMTLLFIGAVERAQLPALLEAGDRTSGVGLKMELQRFACWKHNRIGYAAPETCPEALQLLVQSLQVEVSAAGFAFDPREFSPHVTLLRNVERSTEAQSFPAIFWQADAFMLVESRLSEQGARYDVLKQWPLKG